MNKEFVVVVEQNEEGYFIASIPELRSCYTQVKSLDELQNRIKEAIASCLEVEGERPHKVCFVGIHKIAV